MTVQIIENILKLSNKLGLALRIYGLPQVVEPHIDSISSPSPTNEKGRFPKELHQLTHITTHDLSELS
jgi:hypothetical protein